MLAEDTRKLADYTYALVWIGMGVGVLQGFLLFYQGVYTRKAANAAADGARAALLAERAYVWVEKLTQFEDFAPGKEPRLLATVINSGNTPARVFESGIATIPVRSVAEHLPRPMPDPGMRPSTMTLVAGQHADWGNLLGPVAQSDYDLVMKQGFKLVVFGRLRYLDTFGISHCTDFSFVYNPKQWGTEKLGFVIDPNGYGAAD